MPGISLDGPECKHGHCLFNPHSCLKCEMGDADMTKFAKVTEVKAGTKLITDGGFTCIGEGKLVEVQQDLTGHFFFPCKEGTHYLSGQIDDATDAFIGLVLAP